MFLKKYLKLATILLREVKPMNDYPLSHKIHLIVPLPKSKKMGLKRLCHSTILFMFPKLTIKLSVILAQALQGFHQVQHIKKLASEVDQVGAVFTLANRLN